MESILDQLERQYLDGQSMEAVPSKEELEKVVDPV